mmetsp:Transcript_3382/g.7915  ORF Transcript_3382/g.7915 Transcript_3382/m.7915 type:complete len:323 (-) Transcript_3382:49-1017(-)
MPERSFVIFTDLNGDCDDVYALALACRILVPGVGKLAAVCINSRDAYNYHAAKSLLSYYGRGEVPVTALKEFPGPKAGVLKEGEDNDNLLCKGRCSYTKVIAKKFGKEEGEAKKIYTCEVVPKILKEAGDGSVTFISIGFFTDLSKLLKQHEQLIRSKVSRMVAMAGDFDRKEPRQEYNIRRYDVASAKNALENWPTPVVYVGYSLGASIRTGSVLLNRKGSERVHALDPLTVAYRTYFKEDPDRIDHASWDPVAVYIAVREDDVKFTLGPRGCITVDDKGFNGWCANSNGQQHYIKSIIDSDKLGKKLDNIIIARRTSYMS